MAASSEDTSVVVYDCAAQPELPAFAPGHARVFCRCDGHQGPVKQIAWSPFRSGWLASASADYTAQLWDVSSEPSAGASGPRAAQPVASFRGHFGRVFSVCWDLRNPFALLTGGDDHTLRVWDPRVQLHAAPPNGKEVRARLCTEQKQSKASVKPAKGLGGHGGLQSGWKKHPPRETSQAVRSHSQSDLHAKRDSAGGAQAVTALSQSAEEAKTPPGDASSSMDPSPTRDAPLANAGSVCEAGDASMERKAASGGAAGSSRGIKGGIFSSFASLGSGKPMRAQNQHTTVPSRRSNLCAEAVSVRCAASVGGRHGAICLFVGATL